MINCPYEVLSFYPISPSIGVILINNYSFIRFKCKSLIFHNELKPNDSIQEYVEQEKINSEILKLLKDIPKDKKIPKDELEFLLYKLQQMIITKCKNLNDKYNYKFKKEWRSTAYFCNAMMTATSK